MRKLLEGVRVLDLTQILAGPYCTRMLADFGADVIKIEPPHGDASRRLSTRVSDNRSGYYMWLNCGKRSLALNMKDADAHRILLDLAAQADVVVENMRPGALASKGLGYDDLSKQNKRLVMASISGFGQSGPMANDAAHGLTTEALGGVIDMTGQREGDPMPLGIALADVSSGVYAFGAIVAALYSRERTGEGDYIDVSLMESALTFHETAFMEYFLSDEQVRPTRSGLSHGTVTPYGVYSAPDGHLAIAVGTDPLWQRLTDVIGDDVLRTDERFTTNNERSKNDPEIRRRLEAWLAAQGTVENAVKALEGAGIPCAPITPIADVPGNKQVIARDVFESVKDPVAGSVPLMNIPPRLHTAPATIAGPAPLLGEDNDAVLTELGYSSAQVRDLYETGVLVKDTAS